MAKGKNIVKKTQGMLILILVAVTTVSWLMTVSILSKDGPLELQSQLVEEGNLLLEDGLYVRAAECYEEAISSYNTENNEVLEEKLLQIYKEGNLSEKYEALQMDRIEQGRAKEAEYIAYAGQLLEEGNESRVVSILSQGEEQYDNAQLTELYESIKYSHSLKALDSSHLHIPFGSWYIPVSNGETWGYIQADGDLFLNYKYEQALPFSGSYAVVKLDGVYTLIDTSGNKIAIDGYELDDVTTMNENRIVGIKNGKYYLFNLYFEPILNEGFEEICLSGNGIVAVKTGGMWGLYTSSMEPITEHIFNDIVINSKGWLFGGGNATVKDAAGYYVIDEGGNALFEKRFERLKGCENGLVAAQGENGDWGFINGQGEYIIEPQYQDAITFSHDLGLVKYAGKWGYINRYNNMVIEAEFEQAFPFMNGMALVEDTPGFYKVISLRYSGLF